MIVENLKGKVVDIENAFLNGDLEHEFYMKISEGYDEVIYPRVIWIGSSSKTTL